VKLSSAAGRALKKARSVKLTLTIVADDTAGNRATSTRTVTVRR
jgi:hypothetical protein